MHKIGLVVGETKSEAGGRTVVLPRFVTAALVEHRQRQLVERVAAPTWTDADIVFPSSVGTWLEPRKLNAELTRIGKVTGIAGLHPHALRHSAAAVLLSAGMPLAAVAQQLGHGSSVVTATIYEHVLDQAKITNAATLENHYAQIYAHSSKNAL